MQPQTRWCSGRQLALSLPELSWRLKVRAQAHLCSWVRVQQERAPHTCRALPSHPPHLSVSGWALRGGTCASWGQLRLHPLGQPAGAQLKCALNVSVMPAALSILQHGASRLTRLTAAAHSPVLSVRTGCLGPALQWPRPCRAHLQAVAGVILAIVALPLSRQSPGPSSTATAPQQGKQTSEGPQQQLASNMTSSLLGTGPREDWILLTGHARGSIKIWASAAGTAVPVASVAATGNGPCRCVLCLYPRSQDLLVCVCVCVCMGAGPDWQLHDHVSSICDPAGPGCALCPRAIKLWA